MTYFQHMQEFIGPSASSWASQFYIFRTELPPPSNLFSTNTRENIFNIFNIFQILLINNKHNAFLGRTFAFHSSSSQPLLFCIMNIIIGYKYIQNMLTIGLYVFFSNMKLYKLYKESLNFYSLFSIIQILICQKCVKLGISSECCIADVVQFSALSTDANES